MRWKTIAALAAVLSVAPLFTAGAEAATDEPGQGFAFGQGFKVDPKAGGLSIGIAFGQSTAIHTNQVGRAVSTSTNFGVVGLTLGGQQCDGSDPTWPVDPKKSTPEGQPLPLIVDSRDEAAEAGKTATDWGQPGTANGPFVKSGMATTVPSAKATTTILGDQRSQSQGAFEMGNAKVTSSSGLVNGVREARATVELDYLGAAGTPGSVRMTGLRWDALHRSTGDKKVEGSFAIGSFILNNGPPMTGLTGETAKAAVELANKQVLSALGLRLVAGSVHKSKDVVTVEPLALVVEPNATRDGATQKILTQPVPYPREDGSGTDSKEPYKAVRQRVTEAILKSGAPQDFKDTKQDDTKSGCKAGTYISVVDIAVGSITGAGEFVLSLGGVEASTSEVPKNSFKLDLPDFGPVPDLFIPGEPPLESSFLGTPDIAGGPTLFMGAPGVPGGGENGVPRTQLINPAVNERGPASEPFKGARGGALAVVGLVTLGVIAMVAEGDRRRMRAMLRARGTEPGA